MMALLESGQRSARRKVTFSGNRTSPGNLRNRVVENVHDEELLQSRSIGAIIDNEGTRTDDNPSEKGKLLSEFKTALPSKQAVVTGKNAVSPFPYASSSPSNVDTSFPLSSRAYEETRFSDQESLTDKSQVQIDEAGKIGVTDSIQKKLAVAQVEVDYTNMRHNDQAGTNNTMITLDGTIENFTKERTLRESRIEDKKKAFEKWKRSVEEELIATKSSLKKKIEAVNQQEQALIEGNKYLEDEKAKLFSFHERVSVEFKVLKEQRSRLEKETQDNAEYSARLDEERRILHRMAEKLSETSRAVLKKSSDAEETLLQGRRHGLVLDNRMYQIEGKLDVLQNESRKMMEKIQEIRRSKTDLARQRNDYLKERNRSLKQ